MRRRPALASTSPGGRSTSRRTRCRAPSESSGWPVSSARRSRSCTPRTSPSCRRRARSDSRHATDGDPRAPAARTSSDRSARGWRRSLSHRRPEEAFPKTATRRDPDGASAAAHSRRPVPRGSRPPRSRSTVARRRWPETRASHSALRPEPAARSHARPGLAATAPQRLSGSPRSDSAPRSTLRRSLGRCAGTACRRWDRWPAAGT